MRGSLPRCVLLPRELLSHSPYECGAWLSLNICYLGVVLSQSLAALALFRIHERAVAYSGDPRIFTNVLGRSWSVLVVATFAIGGCFWLQGFAFQHLPDYYSFNLVPATY